MFGYDWFRDNGAVLDFANQKLIVHGRYHDLQPKPFSGWVRRIVVERDTQIPNRCECDVKTKVELSELGRSQPEAIPMWMTEVENLREGVYVSRTLLPDRFSEVPVRILNVSGEPIHLRQVQFVTELHPVDEVLSVVHDGKVKQ